ncbi:tRNA (guanosine(37)-N1)-methyltransferase TrmD [Lactococcus nasutitermitis]|uniref:tRNA (guanine-N(1)-)-methyltransferase n=1 Tax=Lactococcus nasutitermitis TaxID=1652957 RepID=A0ABV9JC04_9LACT|nr:tRNA (guanosine(37)-N1)-methyltransferase TrmD [Lactococcus nasutitermitis]
MRVDILTIFPEMFSPLNQSMVGKAQEKEIVEIYTHDFRENADNKQRHVDDMPYGGGQGMLLMPQPIFDTMDKFSHENARVILLDPAGKKFNQKVAEELAKEEQLVFICGHYEGYDERIKSLVTDEISLGDFVLTGGEVAANVMIDAVVRLLPGVLGKQVSHEDDSFSSGLLEYPQYTRPEDFRGLRVPEVLMSGHHENIRKWRLTESLKKTLKRRPDLLENYSANEEEIKILEKLRETSDDTQDVVE